MKILVLGASNIGRGGRSSSVFYITQEIVGDYVFDFMCDGGISPTPETARLIRSRGGTIFTDSEFIANYFQRQIEWLVRLRKILRAGNYDIVHINADYAEEAIRAVLGCIKLKRIPLVVHAHATGYYGSVSVFKKLVSNAGKKWLIKHTEARIACSREASDFMFGHDGGSEIVHNGISVKKFEFNDETRKRYRKILEIEDRIVVGHVGNFYEPKNHLRLLRIFRKIHEMDNTAMLVLIGEGRLKGMIEREAIKMSLGDSILFLGERNDVKDVLQAFDCFVMPSTAEGFPVAAIEAQASGLCCFLSDAITVEARITERAFRLSLERSDSYWAGYILEKKRMFYDRSNVKLLTQTCEIKYSANQVKDIYRRLTDL